MFLNKLRKEYFYFTFFYIFGIVLYLLSTKYNVLAVHHGPFYYFIAESLINKEGFVPSVKLFPLKSDIVTPQIGVAFVIYISKLISLNYWYVIFYLFHAFFWFLVLLEIKNFSQKNKSLGINYLLLTLIIYIQPYNLNQTAAFSNEAIYYPLLIYFIFYFVGNYENLNFFLKKKFNLIFFILFLIIGTIFRLHNIIFFGTFIFLLLFFTNKKFYKEVILLIFLKFIFLFCFFYFMDLYGVFSFINKIFQLFILENNPIEFYSQSAKKNQIIFNDSINFSKYISLERANILLSVYSSPIPITKIFSNQYIQLLINFLCLLLLIYSLIKIQFSKEFKLFVSIYYLFSSIFIFLLPMNEGNYYLPVSFLNILILYCLFKKILKKYFEFIVISLLVLSVTFFSLIYAGKIKIIDLEVYNHKKVLSYMKSLKKTLKKNNVSIFHPYPNLNNPELWVWTLNLKICNNDLDKCLKNNDTEFNVLFLNQYIDLEDYISYEEKKYLVENNFDFNQEPLSKKQLKMTSEILNLFINKKISEENLTILEILEEDQNPHFTYKILRLKR